MKTLIPIQPRVLLAMAPFVSTDELRYGLNGILFDVEGGKLQLVATDGKRLIIHRPGWEIEGDLRPFILHRDVLPLLAHIEQLSNILIALEYDTETETATIKASNFSISTRAVESTYPPYRNLIPNPMPTEWAPEEMMAHAEFVRDAVEAFTALKPSGDHDGAMFVREPGNPLIFHSRSTTIIVIPMRVKP